MIRLSLFLLAILFPLMGQTRSVVLSWTDTANPAGTQYNVYRQGLTTPACPAPPLTGFTKLNPSPISPKTYTDANVAVGYYCYYVTASATSGANTIESSPSTTASAGVTPYTPTGFTVVVQVTASIQITPDGSGIVVAKVVPK